MFGADPASPALTALGISSFLASQQRRDYLSDSWYEYGLHEGIPRLLDLWDEFGIKVSSFMVADAVARTPEIAREIVNRGHECVAHGVSWAGLYNMTLEEETQFHKAALGIYETVLGVKPIGFNAYWMEDSNNTLGILQNLGFVYHVDDLSRDSPFTKMVNNVSFAIVPYTLRLNDIELMHARSFSTEEFYNQLVNEFNQLYRESKTRRRMMSISSHDRIGK